MRHAGHCLRLESEVFLCVGLLPTEFSSMATRTKHCRPIHHATGVRIGLYRKTKTVPLTVTVTLTLTQLTLIHKLHPEDSQYKLSTYCAGPQGVQVCNDRAALRHQ